MVTYEIRIIGIETEEFEEDGEEITCSSCCEPMRVVGHLYEIRIRRDSDINGVRICLENDVGPFCWPCLRTFTEMTFALEKEEAAVARKMQHRKPVVVATKVSPS